jgi:hypothetical protein
MFKTRRADRSRARVAARAVIREFRVIDGQLGHCLNYSYRWPWERYPEYEWPMHEPVLAATVKDEFQWRKMEDVFATLVILRVLGPELDRDPSDREEAVQMQVLKTLRDDMTEALHIIGRWAA